MERKRLLTHSLTLWRDRGDENQVAKTLTYLSDVNRLMDLGGEGLQQIREALEIYERLGDTARQGQTLADLARGSLDDEQLDAAEEAASRAIDLLGKGEQLEVCQCHIVLGDIYRAKGVMEKAIHHLEIALGIASSLNWHEQLFWVYFSLAEVSSAEGRFDDAHAHIERTNFHAADDIYLLAWAWRQQAVIWNQQRRFPEAKSEALRALDAFEKLEAAVDMEVTRGFLEQIGHDVGGSDSGSDCTRQSAERDNEGKLLETHR